MPNATMKPGDRVWAVEGGAAHRVSAVEIVEVVSVGETQAVSRYSTKALKTGATQDYPGADLFFAVEHAAHEARIRKGEIQRDPKPPAK